ncbi:MAG: Coenzyme F420 hydrogenase/dehydrogenase, beta subunit C-terminal domain [Thermodesulfobacteriota bacterium]
MKVVTVLKTERGLLEEARAFLGRLLEEGVVDYLLAPQEISRGRTLVQTLVKDPVHLQGANPFAPVMPENSATIVSRLTADRPGKKLGVVLKPCEIRGLIELVKLGQADLENLFLIGVDCLGTYEVEDYAGLMDEREGAPEEKAFRVLSEMRRNAGQPVPLRPACRMCTSLTPPLADITLSLLGAEEGFIICLEKDLAGRFGLPETDDSSRRAALAERAKQGLAVREETWAGFREKTKSIGDFADYLATCTRCYACSSACPICFCRVCFFRTETFEPEAERYFRWVEKEGALRMPTEILLYHLTRLNHVAASCVGCGMCESACPRDLPLTTIFTAIGHEVQKALEYEAGRSLDEEIPLSTLRETRG